MGIAVKISLFKSEAKKPNNLLLQIFASAAHPSILAWPPSLVYNKVSPLTWSLNYVKLLASIGLLYSCDNLPLILHIAILIKSFFLFLNNVDS